MSVLGMLKRRNFKVLSYNPTEKLLFPKKFSKLSQKRFYELLASYGFRTLLKDAILHKKSFGVKELEKYCSPSTAQQYLRALLQLKIVQPKTKNDYQLKRANEIYSLGDTLEWYIAKLIQEEFECDALWNVLLEIPSGGDFDVLAECENHLIYLEIKSSPPKSIEIANIHAFLNRVKHLQPHLAIFFEDTTLRMKDKIVPIFESELSQYAERIHDETFRIGHLYITNSKPSILQNLKKCISTYFRET